MKIQKCEYNANNSAVCTNNSTNPSFKGFGDDAVNGMGNFAQSIQGGGFLVSFLIQDALGMVLPRVAVGFNRDKDVTGEYNLQEGFEVLGREILTSPCMMAVAPIVFAITAKFGRATSVNSMLIKRLGNNMKELIKKPVVQNNTKLLKNKEEFKRLFYKDNLEQIFKNTFAEKNWTEDELNKKIAYILEQIELYEKVPDSATLKGLKLSKKKYKNNCLSNIEKYINNLKYESSSDLDMLNKLKIGSEKSGDIKPFDTIQVIEGMIKYSDDVIKASKKCDTIDETLAENIKNSTIAKRFVATVSSFAATVGVLFMLPKIYAKSDLSPAEATAKKLREEEQQKKQDKKEQTQDAVAFKGKTPGSSWFSKFGKFLSNLMSKNESLADEFEYTSGSIITFTNTLMSLLSIFVVLPRGIRAYKRAPIDEDGKKDKSEIYEILIRDVTSLATCIYAVPMLTKLFVSSYENNTGFVLMENNANKKPLKKILDLINPYSNTRYIDIKKLESIYNNVDTQAKMLNFCEYITRNNGDLSKILAKSETAKDLLKNTAISFDKLQTMSKAQKNAKIMDYFKGLDKSATTDKMIKSIFVNGNGKSANKIFAHAKGLNSIPYILSTLVISPFFLGCILPKLTYANTRRIQEKKQKEHVDKTV